MSYHSGNFYSTTNMVSSNKLKDLKQYSTSITSNNIKQQQPLFNGFIFKKKNEKIDWRRIAALDVDRVARELDFTALQENIDHITFCNIEAEIDTRLMDPNFIKLFKLSQLTIEYLLQSQEYLTNLIADSEMHFDTYRSIMDFLKENEDLKKSNEKIHKELSELKKENKKRKKLIEAQQTMINVNQTNYHRCMYCSKVFLNVSYLQAHLSRRHNVAYQPQPLQQQQPQPQPQVLNEFEKELEKIKEKLHQTEIDLQQERAVRLTNAKEDALLKKMEEWKNEQMRKHTDDMNMIKDKFLKEIEELTVRNSHAEKTLYDLQNRVGKQSNVGWLKDEVDIDKEAYARQQTELDMLRAKDDGLSKQIEDLNEKWHYKDLKLKEKYKRQLEEKNMMIEELNFKMSKYNKDFEDELQKRTQHEVRKRQKTESPKMEKQSIERKQQQHHNDFSERSQPPPITPRLGIRTPSPPKSDAPQYRQRTPSRQSITVDLLLPDYCPKLKEALKYDDNVLSTYRNKVKNMLISELGEIGIYPDDVGLSANDFKLKMNEIHRYRDEVSRELPNFNQMRKIFTEICDEHCKQKLSSSLRSSGGGGGVAGGNRVTFHKNLITSKANDQHLNNSISSINKKPINKINDNYQHHNRTRSESDTNDEVSISNAIESNDDDTEPTKQNFNLNRNHSNSNGNHYHHQHHQQQQPYSRPNLQQQKRPLQPQRQHQPLLPQQQQSSNLRAQTRSPYQYSEDDLESVTQMQDTNDDKQSKPNGYVARTAKSMDKELNRIMSKGTKPTSNAVPLFRSASPMKQDHDDSYGSVSSIEMTENSKQNNRHIKNPNQASIDDQSENTSIWASVSQHNNNHHNSNGQNQINYPERPHTATSVLTSNLDSDDLEF